ncbi:hypothetical protein [Mycoplasma hafezii]|uniref:hypothetical protein n=1 Tax=Mycoplasma hafezii TaxID=525886 RepID=UPI003CF1BB4A
MPKKDPVVDYSIYRQFFINDVVKAKKQVAQNKLLVFKKSTRAEAVRNLEGLITELKESKIANKDLISNRKIFIKYKGDLILKGTMPYWITFLGLCFVIVITVALKVF